MSKKLTVAEREFLTDLISKKIAEKKTQQVKSEVEKNPAYIELQKRVEQIQVLNEQLKQDFKQLNDELCTQLGMTGRYNDSPIILNDNHNVSLKTCTFSTYDVRSKVQEKVMYSQVVLGGISEDFVDKLVVELS